MGDHLLGGGRQRPPGQRDEGRGEGQAEVRVVPRDAGVERGGAGEDAAHGRERGRRGGRVPGVLLRGGGEKARRASLETRFGTVTK